MKGEIRPGNVSFSEICHTQCVIIELNAVSASLQEDIFNKSTYILHTFILPIQNHRWKCVIKDFQPLTVDQALLFHICKIKQKSYSYLLLWLFLPLLLAVSTLILMGFPLAFLPSGTASLTETDAASFLKTHWLPGPVEAGIDLPVWEPITVQLSGPGCLSTLIHTTHAQVSGTHHFRLNDTLTFIGKLLHTLFQLVSFFHLSKRVQQSRLTLYRFNMLHAPQIWQNLLRLPFRASWTTHVLHTHNI